MGIVILTMLGMSIPLCGKLSGSNPASSSLIPSPSWLTAGNSLLSGILNIIYQLGHRMFGTHLVNRMAPDALAPCVTRSSGAILLTL